MALKGKEHQEQKFFAELFYKKATAYLHETFHSMLLQFSA